VAGEWNHFRLSWEDSNSGGSMNKKYAYLNGVAFSTNQGSAVGDRTASLAGLIRLGNSWQYNSGFDGAIDEFAIFDDAVDSSSGDNWGNFDGSLPSLAWTAGQTAGTSLNTGVNIFLAHFDSAMDPKEGFVWADYFTGHPEMVFTNGADTLTGDRIRVVTYPYRTRIWTDNTGSQYTPSARTKYSEGYAQGSEIGWMTGFQYHHRAASTSQVNPITSPVLNLRRQVRIWSDEDATPAENTAPINQSYGITLYYPGEIDINHLELNQLFYGLYLIGNPYKPAAPYASQYIRKSAFNNIKQYPVYTVSKTLGSQTIDGNNIASLDYTFVGLKEDSSSNITFSNNIITAYMRDSAAYNQIYLNGGRIFTVSGNILLNSRYPLYLAAGTAKVTISDNEFWRFRRAIQFMGNSFITLSDDTFDGGISSEATNGYFGTALYVAPGTSNVEIADDGSIYGRSVPNEVDINLPPDTTSWLAGSLFRYTGNNITSTNPYHYMGLSSQDNFGNEYVATAIPGVDARISFGKNIANFTNYGIMRTTGADLDDTLVKTGGGYAWRMESTSESDALEYTAKVVGVSGSPLAVTGYLRLNANYGTANLPTVTLSGLGMTGANLIWTAQSTSDTWQQFVVSGTPTESALATLTISVKSEPVIADSGTAENVDDAQSIYLPTMIEDTDKNWTWNEWAGYKLRDDQNFTFDIVGNTANRLFLKGTRIPFGNTLPTQPYGANYEIFSPPYVYLDDVSVLSGTVDTGTLDFHSSGQPVSPWLSTGLTAAGIWGAQWSSFSDITGSFGQLLQDALIARYGDISDPTPASGDFDTNLPTSDDDYYNNGVIIFTEGANKGVVRRISDYNGSAKNIVVDPAFPQTPADGDRFAILAATANSAASGGATAAEIWSYALRQLTTEDLEGGGSLATQADITALNNISAADIWAYANKTITGITSAGAQAIWDAACAILNTSGSVGKLVCDNLDVAVSSRSSLTAAQVWAETTKTITGLSDPALAALANSVWSNTTRELSAYGNTLTAQAVWNALTSSLTTIDSIGKLLVTNVDETISSRSSQSSLDTHESAEAAFRTQTTETLGAMTVNVAEVLTQLSDIETKIEAIQTTLNSMDDKLDVLGTSISSIKTTVEEINTKVTAIQTVTNSILTKWGSYSAGDIIGYVNTLEDYLGDPDDASSSETVFGRIKEVKESIGTGGTIDLVYSQVQETHDKLVEVQTELGFNGKSTTAYDEMVDIKENIDEVNDDLSTLDTNTTSIATSVTSVSNSLKTVTDRIGQVSVDSFTQLFEVKKTDIDYLKNKVIELKAVADINRQLMEKTVNEPVVKVIMEWGSVIIKFVIVNPSSSTAQKIPFKAFLPKEAKQEYIMDLGGLTLNYDATTEQYYVTADIALKAGESIIRSVEIKDVWTISDDEVASLRKQSEELSNGLKSTSYFAQGLTLKTDINTRLDKVARKQKDNNATPQDHILAYRENQEDLKAVNENIKGLKDLLLSSSAGSNFLASIGGIQTFSTWGIVLVLIFGMGALGSFYYSLWKRKMVTVAVGKNKDAKTIELPTPSPFELIGLRLSWVKKVAFGWVYLVKDMVMFLTNILKKITVKKATKKGNTLPKSFPKKTLLIVVAVSLPIALISGGILSFENAAREREAVEKAKISIATVTPVPSNEEKVANLVKEMDEKAKEEKEANEQVEKYLAETGENEKQVLSATSDLTAQYQQLVAIKQTPTGWLNVRKLPSTSSEILTKVFPGESYPFSEVKNGWYNILLKDLTEGWVSGEYVVEEKQISTQDKEYVQVVPPEGDGVNVRETPNKEGMVIKIIYLKGKYLKLAAEDGWVKIELLDGKHGWVAEKYVQ